ncbi:uncharacterized protein TNCV_527041 [Trichonephila clavipes]|nr:uncharacterized protein TNCV_527041 [Trichonephila clavipes]
MLNYSTPFVFYEICSTYRKIRNLEHERRQLHEVLVPQLQRDWSSLGIDIQLVDVQNGADEDAIIEPQAIAQQLEEIEDCHKTSLGCFFLVMSQIHLFKNFI